MIETNQVEVRRVLPAPVDEVFRWWTEPALLRRWMSPVGEVEAEVDLRVGGQLRIVMKDGAVEIEHHGEYFEIDPPRRLVFTWHSRYTGGGSLVTVSLEPAGEASTRVLIVHSQLPPSAAESHAGGWAAMLERLEREVDAS
ncbi:MAG: SRPBCC domain-containing protein [Candidatus Dormiibacterota bacterium]